MLKITIAAVLALLVSVTTASAGQSVVAQTGDNLWTTAARMTGQGDRWVELLAVNPGVTIVASGSRVVARVQPGQVLHLPTSWTPSVADGQAKIQHSTFDWFEMLKWPVALVLVAAAIFGVIGDRRRCCESMHCRLMRPTPGLPGRDGSTDR